MQIVCVCRDNTRAIIAMIGYQHGCDGLISPGHRALILPYVPSIWARNLELGMQSPF